MRKLTDRVDATTVVTALGAILPFKLEAATTRESLLV